jgi:hypothetical protein
MYWDAASLVCITPPKYMGCRRAALLFVGVIARFRIACHEMHGLQLPSLELQNSITCQSCSSDSLVRIFIQRLRFSLSSSNLHFSTNFTFFPPTFQLYRETSFIMDKAEIGNIDVAESPSIESGFELRNYSQLGGTENDERDMQMLGRTQQLNVRRLTPTFRMFVSLTTITAQFQIHLNSRLCMHLDEHLGDRLDVRFNPVYA